MYKGFAAIYDALMHDAPYDEWAEWLDKKLCMAPGPSDGKIVVDLGCGTGSISVRLAKMGYSLIGVDSSPEMLAVAHEKAACSGLNILFVNQDIRELDLYGTASGVVSVCDVLNYMLSKASLLKVFHRVHLFLEPGGVFVFDMNTPYKFREKMADKVFSGMGTGDEFFAWKNLFCDKCGINEYNVLFYDGKEKFIEKHLQKSFESHVVKSLLELAGFTSIEATCGYSDRPLGPESIRMLHVAQKPG